MKGIMNAVLALALVAAAACEKEDPADGIDGGTGKVFPLGALRGEFTVADDGQGNVRKVFFSKGNLTYNVTDGKWAFYENQYDCADGYDAGLVSLFTWGCGEWSVNPDTQDCGDSFSDWGEAYCLSQGVEPTTKWRTLSGGDGSGEWNYLLNSRTMKNGGPSYSDAMEGITIDGVFCSGLFIYPDDYDGDEVGGASADSWAEINDAGIVFLPAAGFRSCDSVMNVGVNLSYWSSIPDGVLRAFCVTAYPDSNGAYIGGTARYSGYSVRLVSDIP